MGEENLKDRPDIGPREGRAILARRTTRAVTKLLPAVGPVFVPDRRGEPEVIGSAVFLRVGPSHFVITAAHVTDRAGGQVYVGGESRIVGISGQYSRTLGSGAGSADPFDLAVLPLRDSEISELRDCRFLNLEDCEIGERAIVGRPGSSKYLLLGYPFSKQKGLRDDTVLLDSMKLLAEACPDSEYTRFGKNPAGHLMIGFDKKRSANLNGVVTPPDPYGVSGGGIFRLRGWTGEEAETETLVAIAIEWTRRAGKSIIGTRIDVCLDGIRRRYPLLAPWIDRRFRQHRAAV